MGADSYKVCWEGIMSLGRIITILSIVYAIRAVQQTWGALDNEWPLSFDHFVRPTMYMSAIFSVVLAFMALTAAIGIYKKHLLRLIYLFPLPCFTISLLSIFNDVTELALMVLGKDLFLAECAKEETKILLTMMQTCNDCAVEEACDRIWNSSLVWISIGAVFNLGIDVCFIWCICRFKKQQNQLSRVIPKQDQFIECRHTVIDHETCQEASTLVVGQIIKQ